MYSWILFFASGTLFVLTVNSRLSSKVKYETRKFENLYQTLLNSNPYSKIPENGILFQKFDFNGDKHLTKEEYKEGLDASTLPQWLKDEIIRKFEDMDTNNSGFIEMDEF